MQYCSDLICIHQEHSLLSVRFLPRLSYYEFIEYFQLSFSMEDNPFSFNIVVDIGLMQTAYTTSEAMGSVSVCVDIDSAQLARNVSVTIRSVTAGQAVGRPFKFHTQKLIMCTSYTEILGMGSPVYDKIVVCTRTQLCTVKWKNWDCK